jgi:serine/threonine protein kinase
MPPPPERPTDSPSSASSRLAEAVRLCLAFRGSGRKDVAAFLGEHGELRELLEGMLGEPEPDAGALAPLARTFGDYVLERELGRGGVGVVYAATQRALGRRVAVKLLSSSLLHSERSLWRFQREARLLAQLEHPGIMRVIDAGTVDGVPYYAMELVAGASLASVLGAVRRHGLATASGATIAAALAGAVPDAAAAGQPAHLRAGGYLPCVAELGAQVADALAFAHAAGVVHRDVKPGNVLVRQDGTAVLSDFGIARQEDAPSMTLTGEFAGTPYYIAPEQARGTCDHRSDIYSLGVTLYELFTLQRPFDGETTAGVLQRIQREEPPAPARLNPGIPGDLEAVVLKAMAKEPGRRYAGAGQLAADLRAWIRGEPISARRPSRWQRVRRWARREPWQAAAAAAALALVAVSLAFTARLLHEGRRTKAALRDAQRAQALAQANFVDAMAAVDQMLLRVGESDLRHVPQMEPVRRELLQRAARFYEGFVAKSAGDPAVRLQAAAARDSLGRLHQYLGDRPAAVAAHEAALRDLDALLAAAPTDANVVRARANAQLNLAAARFDAGELAASRALHEAATAALQQLSPREDATRRLLARALTNHGQIEGAGNPGRARELLRAALAELQPALAAAPDDVDLAIELHSARYKLATVELVLGGTQTAADLLRQAQAGADALRAREPGHVEARRLAAAVHDQLALVWITSGQLAAAEDAGRSGVEIWRSLAADFPSIANYRESLGRAWANLAGMRAADERSDDAIAAAREAVAVLDELAAAWPQVARYRLRLAMALANLGLQLVLRPEAASEGDQCMDRARAVAEALHREDPTDGDYAAFFADLLVLFGDRERKRGAHDAARTAFATARDVCAALGRVLPDRLDLRDAHAHALLRLGEQAEADGDQATAMAHALRAAELLRESLQKEARQVLRREFARGTHALRARLSLRAGDVRQAAAAVDELLALGDAGDDALSAAAAVAGCLPAWPAGRERDESVARAVGLLRENVERGQLDADRLDAAPDLEPLRQEPAYREMRRVLAAR